MIPARSDPERDAVASCWERSGGKLLRLDRFWEPPELDRTQVRLYGHDTFCLVVAQKLNLGLLSPPDDLLVQVDPKWLQREVRLSTLGSLETFPVFVKPLVPKAFRAGVYADRCQLDRECAGLEATTPALVAPPVTIAAEARGFILDGKLLTCAIYEGEGSLAEASGLLSKIAAQALLPATCVLDVALVEGKGWALLEANAAWGSGLNGCNPQQVVPCLARATYAMAIQKAQSGSEPSNS
ncbi:ATP-grasp domain-containing protein [bacterium]|nr:ATP-grasp domain-containing protein [bacterium]